MVTVIIVIEAPRYPYSRPEFLYFSDDEIAVSADRITRPVLVPKDPCRMPVFAGYAEVINAGKTEKNEDQAAARLLSLMQLGYQDATDGGAPTSNVSAQSSSTTTRRDRRFRASSEIRRAETEMTSDRSETTTAELLGGGGGGGGRSRRHSDDELLQMPARSYSTEDGPAVPRAEAAYFGVFDGHAGTGAAIMAANCLHEHLRERLSQVLETVLHLDRQEQLLGLGASSAQSTVCSPNGKQLTRDGLVIGALETAFVDMDEQICEEKQLWRIPGGAAACVALFFLGKVYVANAGDCRALLFAANRLHQLSTDFTPDTERQRLQCLAFRQPDLIGTHFTRLEYSRFLTRKDLKKKVLYRDWYMDGWAAKTVRESDIKPPLISDGIRKRRLLNTIGVTRGFGDHHLMTVDDKIPIKPFLTPVPEVSVFDLQSLNSLTDRDVLILASDGLWDVLSNEDAAAIVQSALVHPDADDRTKYTLAAQDLIIAARGDPTETGRWQLANGGGGASTDDITVFVIPLKHALAPPATDDDDDVELLQ
uniref:PPM-type phosphatase domain-containing protein n=1 Tax=Plectus sambesii TaxID=2011161 RepID=A0A914W8C7_9BILA